ncbi:MAG TPA: TRAP transporter small permease [Bacteroidetes bacterium]|nr:tripartite ATP-independent periplasmic transporters, DctQ component [bacterium BMS3Bbin04]HDO65135.1 TRAP transporter small permease [Bacteroidota bacterium]HEX04260.1 TRAP transporter small permease [Bacteroidota bacterium]
MNLRRALGGIDKGLTYIVSTIVVLLLSFMVILSFTQVILRNVAGQGIVWAEIVLQHSVLAVAMFGAVLAARQGRQIAIDVFSHISGPLVRRTLAWAGGLFAITISIILAHGAWVFVLSEREFGSELVDGLPAWPFQLVIPIGFALLAFQMLLNLLLGRAGSAILTPNIPDQPQQNDTNPDGQEDA